MIKDLMKSCEKDGGELPLNAILIGDKGTNMFVTSEEIEELTVKYNIRYFEVSSEDNYEDVEEAFYALATDIYHAKTQRCQNDTNESESQQQQQQQSFFSKLKNYFSKH